MIFSNKTKAADAEWKIKIFRQGKKNMVEFIIKFEALAMKADRQITHDIFVKEEYMSRYHQNNIGISTNHCTRDTQEVKDNNNVSWTGVQVYRRTI